MERICSWCKRRLGERCQRCGSEQIRTFLAPRAVERLARDLGLPSGRVEILTADPVNGAILRCEDCGLCYLQGSDGQTHGMCGDCVCREVHKYLEEQRTKGALLKC